MKKEKKKVYNTSSELKNLLDWLFDSWSSPLGPCFWCSKQYSVKKCDCWSDSQKCYQIRNLRILEQGAFSRITPTSWVASRWGCQTWKRLTLRPHFFWDILLRFILLFLLQVFRIAISTKISWNISPYKSFRTLLCRPLCDTHFLFCLFFFESITCCHWEKTSVFNIAQFFLNH